MDISRSLRWVRGLRKAKQLGLSSNALEAIESSIRGEAGLREPLPSEELAHQDKTSAVEKLELRLRKLAQARVAWGNIEAVLWELYAQTDDASSVAGKMVELGLVHATPTELINLLAKLSVLDTEFYQDLRADVREPLFVLLWQTKSTEIIGRILRGVRQDLLVPIEKLYRFYDQLRKSDLIEAFMVFNENQTELLRCVKAYGDKVELEMNRVLFDAGKLAFDLGYDGYCRDILRKLDSNSAYYPEALNLLLRTKVDEDCSLENIFVRRLNQTKGWRERVKLFYEFLGETKRLGGIKDINRPLLNELLADPLKWVPASPDAWGAMARAIVDHAGLEQLLPNIWCMFANNILRIYASDLDSALWSPVLDAHFFDRQDQYYWHGIALFHRYLANPESEDSELWQAADLLHRAKEHRSRPLPVDWEMLNRTAYQLVHKQLSMSESKRTARLRQLRMALDPSKLVRSDIEEYLKEIKQPPLAVLDRLIAIARYNEEAQLELNLLKRKAEQSHFTNLELERVWGLAAKLNEFDLAWRAATILKSRDVLDERIFPSWAISGEKRSEYHLNIPQLENVVDSFRDLSLDEQKFLKAIVRIGHQIPNLLLLLDARIKVVKPAPVKPGSKEYEVDKILNALGWLGNVKRYYQYDDDYVAHSLPIPSFIHVLPDNTWSMLLVKLSQRLGLTAWNWKLSNLKKYIDGLMPQIASGKLGGSWGVGRWLKNLNPDGRNAWCDLASIINKFSDEQGYEIISILLTRIAVIINQNHIQALNSLRTMRWSVYNIWQLENWLLSDCYTQIRKKFGTTHSVPVPLSLRKMSTILKEK